MRINNNPEFSFTFFRGLLGPITYSLSAERSFAPSNIFDDDLKGNIIHLNNSHRLVNGHFFVGDVAIVLCYRGLFLLYILAILGVFCATYSLVTSSMTKIPRESFLAAYDCFLAHPEPSHTSSGASPDFAGGVQAFSRG